MYAQPLVRHTSLCMSYVGVNVITGLLFKAWVLDVQQFACILYREQYRICYRLQESITSSVYVATTTMEPYTSCVYTMYVYVCIYVGPVTPYM